MKLIESTHSYIQIVKVKILRKLVSIQAMVFLFLAAALLRKFLLLVEDSIYLLHLPVNNMQSPGYRYQTIF